MSAMTNTTAPQPLELVFNLRCFEPPRQVGRAERQAFADEVGLGDVAPRRISALLIAQMMAYAGVHGVDPNMIAAEIKQLEGLTPGLGHGQTKPPTPFKAGGRLAGLYHKHFTASTVSIVSSNILAARPPEVMMRIAEEELSQGASAEDLQRFTDRVVLDGYERRAEGGRLTGEWIVYAPIDGLNHYLCLATHTGGDDEVLGYLNSVTRHEYPQLVDQLPHLFT
ncbi:hypothetical protein JY96_21200 [Aquabacterium sp. NJ1]|uniref:hypothetical protein n=1 Tax=Aquabacterium sp. NJ1 TaxID=1538295 RepID=UPI00052C5214|nr:hypothetical protein [Aquabacterium sp. NJ1]KGM38695.1 hypothetical protein JY96_21200 [Aquabacterium sp. NJ1]